MRNIIGQHFIIGLKGPQLLADEAEFIVKNNIGGVVLFKRNCESPEQVHNLASDVQALRHRMVDKAPIFVSIDMEGGRVHRLQPPFTQWPALAKVGAIDSTSVAFKFAYAMGVELRAVGINLDFAPSVDIYSNPKNTVIGDRALGTNHEVVSKLSSALVRGYIKAGVMPCAKHFPGHGNTLIDSHEDLPVEEKSLAELEEMELQPFKKAFRARLDLVMTSHIKFPKIDPEWPVTLSKTFLTDILRTQLRYRGMVITDDLDMGAMIKHYDKKAIPVRALQAGADILLYCNDPSSPPLAIEAIEAALKDGKLERARLEKNYQQIITLKKEKIENPDPLPLDEASRLIAHPDHLRLAKCIVDGSVPADLLDV
jgi:beta-N-acetylhexosaminidase